MKRCNALQCTFMNMGYIPNGFKVSVTDLFFCVCANNELLVMLQRFDLKRSTLYVSMQTLKRKPFILNVAFRSVTVIAFEENLN